MKGFDLQMKKLSKILSPNWQLFRVLLLFLLFCHHLEVLFLFLLCHLWLFFLLPCFFRFRFLLLYYILSFHIYILWNILIPFKNFKTYKLVWVSTLYNVCSYNYWFAVALCLFEEQGEQNFKTLCRCILKSY